ncbi:hypothetical protein [Aquitalea denitrificans]|uniref:hypothetical protein n=1 Tax=Aquitalea denitrificans TaxID=519081 RepID=UPI001356B32F|nr:hypothetical protein [Aquitalea denitrificans]
MRHALIGISLSLMLGPVATLQAQVRLDINISSYPALIQIPGYPVYYDPSQQLNYFFYGGRYWIFHEDNWYYSSWYNGPWTRMEANLVPVFIWRIPLRYYQRRPAYFQGWNADEAPRWDQHWGTDWKRHHPDWQQWDRQSVPAASPPPGHQKNDAPRHYPRPTRQQPAVEQPPAARLPPGLSPPEARPPSSVQPATGPAHHARPPAQDIRLPAGATPPGPANLANPQAPHTGGAGMQHAAPLHKAEHNTGTDMAPGSRDATHPPPPATPDDIRKRPGTEP